MASINIESQNMEELRNVSDLPILQYIKEFLGKATKIKSRRTMMETLSTTSGFYINTMPAHFGHRASMNQTHLRKDIKFPQ